MGQLIDTTINPLRQFLPRSPWASELDRGVADLRASDPHKQQFFEHLLPAGAEIRLISSFTTAGGRPPPRQEPPRDADRRRDRRRGAPARPGYPAGTEREHRVRIVCDEHGTPLSMTTFIGSDQWRHTARTAERTLRVPGP